MLVPFWSSSGFVEVNGDEENPNGFGVAVVIVVGAPKGFGFGGLPANREENVLGCSDGWAGLGPLEGSVKPSETDGSMFGG